MDGEVGVVAAQPGEQAGRRAVAGERPPGPLDGGLERQPLLAVGDDPEDRLDVAIAVAALARRGAGGDRKAVAGLPGAQDRHADAGALGHGPDREPRDFVVSHRG